MNRLLFAFLFLSTIHTYAQTDSLKKVAVHASYYGGIWVPTNNLSIVGNHPVAGIQFGIRSTKILLDLTIEFKFLKSKNEYLVFHENMLHATDHFFGGYFGLDGGYNFYSKNLNHFDLLVGAGLDGFDALKIDNEVEKSINSFNYNFGLGYRRDLGQYTYIGIDLKHNFFSYSNEKGTNLDGYASTFRLKFGINAK